MRIINIDLSQDARCPQKVFGGNAREHNESKLVVKLPERMLRDDISYYYFEFQTVLGEHIVSPNIYKNELSDGNKISVTLWEQLLPFAGDLSFCVNAVNLAEDNTITIKGKTSICALQILKSPTGDDALIDVSSTKNELQEVIDKALQDAKDSGDFKGDPGDVNTLQMNTACANALRGSAFGSAVQMDDVSPNEHTLGVKVSNKNLIKYPYTNTSKTTNGVTFTVNSDGSITVSGTATEEVMWSENTLIPLQHDKQYTFSGYFIGNGVTLKIMDSTYADFKDVIEPNQAVTFTPLRDKYFWFIMVAKGVTANATLKPQLELGTTATAYTPYISDLSTVNVTRFGKNLFDTNSAVKLNGGSSFSVTNNTITVSQTSKSTFWSANVPIPSSLSGKIVTLSAKSNTSGANVAGLRIQWITNSGLAGGGMIIGKPDSAGNIVVTGTVPAQPDETHNNLCLMFYSNVTGTLETNTTYTATYSDIQIELGTTVTSYESYQEQSYTPTADGTVSGVKSLYPTTTLMTDTEGVIIDAEYNRDINKAFAELQQAILSMGGNV